MKFLTLQFKTKIVKFKNLFHKKSKQKLKINNCCNNQNSRFYAILKR